MSDEWSDRGRVAEYLAREVPHRRIAEQMLLQALPEQVDRFVDLGTGDGRLLALVGSRYPGAEGTGLDSSVPMLDRARDRGSQYTSAEFTQALDDNAVLGSLGSTGDAYDNAMAESFVDSFKTELIADRTWRSVEQAELAIVEWVSWFNHDRLHSSIGDIPPVEFEQNYWERVEAEPPPGSTRPTGSLRRAADEHLEPLPSTVKLQATDAT